LIGAVLVCSLALPACSSFSSGRPPIPDSTLTDVLVEMHLVNSRLQLDVDTLTVRPFPDSVLAKYGVDRPQLEETLRYYSRRPGAFSSLYEGVIDTLNATQRRELRQPSSPPGSQETPDERPRRGELR